MTPRNEIAEMVARSRVVALAGTRVQAAYDAVTSGPQAPTDDVPCLSLPVTLVADMLEWSFREGRITGLQDSNLEPLRSWWRGAFTENGVPASELRDALPGLHGILSTLVGEFE